MIVAALATMALALAPTAFVATSANATGGGSDDPTPYTVTAEGITLPAGVTFPDGGHVNIQSTQGDRGIHFESLNWPADHPKKYYIGKSFIPWSAFGLSGDFCVSWVQISMYNQHYGEGGQPPVCSTPPKPKEAKAWVDVDQQATCEAPSTVKFSIENATWDSPTWNTTPGSHSRSATANQDATFPGGGKTTSVNYTISPPKPPQSTDPSGDCYVPPTPPKEVDSNPQVTKLVECGKATLTFTNNVPLNPGETGKDAHFTYTDALGQVVPLTVPANSTPVVIVLTFPEDSGDKNVKVWVDGKLKFDFTVETDCVQPPKEPITFTPPTVVDECGVINDRVILGTSPNGTFSQVTLAGDNGTLVHKAILTNTSNQPLPVPGDGDTYVVEGNTLVWTFVTTNEPCPPVVVDNNPDYKVEKVCGSVTITFTNKVILKDGETAEAAEFTYTDANGTVVPVSVPVNETKVVTIEFPEDSGDKVVEVVNGKHKESITVETDCKPNPVSVTPPAPTFVDKCGVENDTFTLPDTDKVDYTVNDTFTNGARTVVITGTVKVEHGFFPKPGDTDTYTLVNGKAVWTHTFTDEACPTPTPTPKPTPTKSATPAPVAASGKLPPTGGEMPVGIFLGGGFLLAAGIAVTATSIVRRRAASTQQ